MGMMISNLLYPTVAKGLPNFSDLVGAWTDLNWHKLTSVEPRGSAALVHMGEDPMAVSGEEFGYGRDVEVEAAIVQDFDGCGWKFRVEDYPFHDVHVVGSFRWKDVGLVEMDLHISTGKGCPERGKPVGFKMWNWC